MFVVVELIYSNKYKKNYFCTPMHYFAYTLGNIHTILETIALINVLLRIVHLFSRNVNSSSNQTQPIHISHT